MQSSDSQPLIHSVRKAALLAKYALAYSAQTRKRLRALVVSTKAKSERAALSDVRSAIDDL